MFSSFAKSPPVRNGVIWSRQFVDPHSIHTGRRNSLKEKKKSCVFEFWKIFPRWETMLFGVIIYFLFLFLQWEN